MRLSSDLADRLRAALAAHGLSAHADRLLAVARPGVALHLAGPSTGRVGESRIGGVPDLPEGAAWPGADEGAALVFLAQFALADVPRFDGSPLPDGGMLYVFLGSDEPASDVEVRFVLAPPDAPLARAEVPGDPDDLFGDYDGLVPHALGFALVADLPRWATNLHERLTDAMDEAEQSAYHDFVRTFSGEAGMLFGHVATVGHDTREDAAVVREFNPGWLYDYDRRDTLSLAEHAEHWHAFLRLESVDAVRLNFWDAGFLSVLLPDDAVAPLDLAHAYAAIETS